MQLIKAGTGDSKLFGNPSVEELITCQQKPQFQVSIFSFAF